MHAMLSVWRPFVFGAPELVVILALLLVLFSGNAVPVGGRPGARWGRLSPREIQFLLCLAALLAISCGILLARQFPR